MTEREIFLAKIFGILAVVIGVFLSITVWMELSVARNSQIQGLESRLSVLKTQTTLQGGQDLRSRMKFLEEGLWPQGTLDALTLGDRIRTSAQKRNLTVLSGRLRRESPAGALWEWQFKGSALGFFQFLDGLESWEHPLIFKALDLRQDSEGLRITMEVGFGVKN